MMARRTLIAAAALAAFAAPAFADYPERVIRLVVPYAAGGGVDALARPLAKEMSEILGQNVIVENKPSANGQVGMSEVARAAPDGYTLVINSAAYSIGPAFYPKLPYDTFKDFSPVTVLAANPLMLVASKEFKPNNLAEMIAMARKGEQVNFAAPGTAGIHFLAGELMGSTAGVKWTSVPYKGAGNAFPDLISGQAHVMFDNPGSSLPLVQSGRLKLIATTGTKRSAVTPNVPTVSETLPGFDAANWFVLSAPAKTPQAVLDKLNQAAAKAMQAPSVKQMLERNGIEVIMNSPKAAAEYVQAEARKWGKIVVDNKLTAQ
jgi:tripartite-type tricarboxylate transporter receptor subunit TctC